MRLINADDAIRKMESVMDMQDLYLPIHFKEMVIDELPTVDAVEVVRCKDCKECEIDDIFHDYWCNGRKVWKDHYCACGERRTDETD